MFLMPNSRANRGRLWTPGQFAPPQSGWFPLQGNSPVMTDNPQRGLYFNGAAGGTIVRYAVRPLPGVDFSVVARVIPNLIGSNTSVGICLYDSGGGRMFTSGPMMKSSAWQAYLWNCLNWNNPNSVNSDANNWAAPVQDIWLRMDYHASAKTADWYLSFDGVTWWLGPSGNTWVTNPTHYGLYGWSTTSYAATGYFTYYSAGEAKGRPRATHGT